MNAKEFGMHRFDLLTGLLLFLIILSGMLHFSHDVGRDEKALDWALHAADLVLGVILGGLRMATAHNSSNGNGGTNGSTNPKP